jgi:integrase/recombinase XerD
MRRQAEDQSSLYTDGGERKYLNRQERGRVLRAMKQLEPERALFALLLAWTGARLSEVLAVEPGSFQVERSVVALRTLKRRRPHVREIPIPPDLMSAIDAHFGLAALQGDPTTANRRLWRFSRVTAWRCVKGAMRQAGIEGRRASPRGLRHAFAIAALQAAVPITLVQRWLGHAGLATTAIYTQFCGAEEADFAARLWTATARQQMASTRQRSPATDPGSCAQQGDTWTSRIVEAGKALVVPITWSLRGFRWPVPPRKPCV